MGVRSYYRYRIARTYLIHAMEHLRPLAEGDTTKGIAPNAEALAISTLSLALVMLVGRRKRGLK